MKKNFLRIMCAVLALVMFAGVAPKNAYAASDVKAPKSVKIALTEGYFSLTWNKVKGAKGYAIYRSVNGGSYKKIDEVKEVMYSDEETHKNGDKLSYYVKAYKKSGSNKVWSDKSKAVSRTFSTKDNYKKLRSTISKYNKKNGVESPEGTFSVGSMPDFSTIVGAAYVEEGDIFGFTFAKSTEDATVLFTFLYAPDSDPYYTYSASTEDGDVTGIFFVNPSKITKKTKVKLSDAFVWDGETDGSFDHEKALNEAIKGTNSYIKSYAKDLKVKMSDFGFNNYK